MACQGLQYIVDLEDEIALEGLDGITLEGRLNYGTYNEVCIIHLEQCR